MNRHLSRFIDDYRIWYKVTFQRGRILTTRSDAWEAFDHPDHYRDPRLFYGADGHAPLPVPLDGDHVVERDASGTAVPGVSEGRARSSGNGRVHGPYRSRPAPPSAIERVATIERFTYPSRHAIRDYPWPETNRAVVRLYRLRDRPGAPVAILCHGWAHDALRGVERIFVEPLLREGYSVALPSLPLHLERTPAGAFSGEMMVTGDVVLTVQAFRQAVGDLDDLVEALRARGHTKVGLVGYSLGGYLAGLLACLRDDLDFVVIGAAGDSVVSTILDTGLGANVREDLSRSGMHRRDALARAWGIISPGRLTPRVPRDRILIIAGRHDRIMLESSVRVLWEAWGRPPIRWEEEGHYTLLALPGRLIRRAWPLLALQHHPARVSEYA